jgi:hypothetical protein
MHKYSVGSEKMLIAAVSQIATEVDIPSTRDMRSGPISLQAKSIRRI